MEPRNGFSMANFTELTGLPLNMLMEIKDGIVMANFIGKMALLLNMQMDIKDGILMGDRITRKHGKRLSENGN